MYDNITIECKRSDKFIKIKPNKNDYHYILFKYNEEIKRLEYIDDKFCMEIDELYNARF